MKSITLLLITFVAFGLNAQDSTSTYDRQSSQNYDYEKLKPGKSKFMMRGYYHAGFQDIKTDGDEKSDYIGGTLAPILMYKQSDRLFFESEFDGTYKGGEFEWDLEYADMSYILNKYMTIRAGKFILPFGTFMEKLHPAWINRLSTRPLGFGHDGIAPTSDVGVEIRGAFHTGPIKINYQVYSVNGPQLKDGSNEPDEAGMLEFGFMEDNNTDRTMGGRIGIFPFTNSMMEVGFSAMSGKVGSKGSDYANVRANLYALDFSFIKNLDFMKSVIDIKGQYNYSQIGNADYFDLEDTTGIGTYTFDNVSDAYYAQLSIRPSLVSNNFIRKLEFVGRYSVLNTPEKSLWASNQTQTAVGINYWLDWRTVIKVGYQITDGLNAEDQIETISSNMFYIHWAMGF